MMQTHVLKTPARAGRSELVKKTRAVVGVGMRATPSSRSLPESPLLERVDMRD